jgi:molybdopterin-guanine dinucleotide biosynthesis protein A
MDGAPALGAVLAGGRSTRMGRSKAMVELGGRPLIAYPLEAIAAAGLEPVVVAKPDSELPPLDCRVVREAHEPVHPLAGLVAALEAADGRPVIALACDLPFVPAELLAWLAHLPDAVAVTFAAGRLHPLLARYASEVGRLFASALPDPMPLTEAVVSLDPRIVSEQEVGRFGDPERIAFNVNSPEDLERARELLEAPPRDPAR